MAFNGGAGIHGIDPSESSSIGHDAAHGCVRMRIPDVISLYARSPVHTPVYVTWQRADRGDAGACRAAIAISAPTARSTGGAASAAAAMRCAARR